MSIKQVFPNCSTYPDFNDATALANGLSLFENHRCLAHALATNVATMDQLICWIGDDLHAYSLRFACSVIAIPYRINQTIAGRIAILRPKPHPLPPTIWALAKRLQNHVSETLHEKHYTNLKSLLGNQAPLSRL